MNEVYDPRPNDLTQTNVAVSNLTAGESYVFRVFAINSHNTQVPKDQWNYSETIPVEFFLGKQFHEKSRKCENQCIQLVIMKNPHNSPKLLFNNQWY